MNKSWFNTKWQSLCRTPLKIKSAYGVQWVRSWLTHENVCCPNFQNTSLAGNFGPQIWLPDCYFGQFRAIGPMELLRPALGHIITWHQTGSDRVTLSVSMPGILNELWKAKWAIIASYYMYNIDSVAGYHYITLIIQLSTLWCTSCKHIIQVMGSSLNKEIYIYLVPVSTCMESYSCSTSPIQWHTVDSKFYSRHQDNSSAEAYSTDAFYIAIQIQWL